MFPVKSIDKRDVGRLPDVLAHAPAQLAVFTNRPIYGDKEWKEEGPLTVSRFPPSYEITRVYRLPPPYIVSRPPQPLPLLRQDARFEIQRLREREREKRAAITFNGNRRSNLESRFGFFNPQRKSMSLSLLLLRRLCFSPLCFSSSFFHSSSVRSTFLFSFF